MSLLVLSRRKNEGIVIDSSIVVTVVEIRGDKVRLGIETPKEMAVHRREVWDAIHREQRSKRFGDLEIGTSFRPSQEPRTYVKVKLMGITTDFNAVDGDQLLHFDDGDLVTPSD